MFAFSFSRICKILFRYRRWLYSIAQGNSNNWSGFVSRVSSSSETQGHFIVGAGKSLNGREENPAEEKIFPPPLTAPGSPRMGCPERDKQFADSDLVEFLSGSMDSAINFSGSADLETPIHPPP